MGDAGGVAWGLGVLRRASGLPAVMIGLMLIVLLPIGCTTRPSDPTSPGAQRVSIAGRTFHLRIAASPRARYRGLSDRRRIPPRGGMLFVFPDARRRTFVMRRCLVPIDILFLSPAGRIVSMYHMRVEPYDTPESQLTPYPSRWPARYAIELRGGTIDKLDLHTARKINLPRERLKRLTRTAD